MISARVYVNLLEYSIETKHNLIIPEELQKGNDISRIKPQTVNDQGNETNDFNWHLAIFVCVH